MGCRVPGMSTQEYRRSYNYRSEYFKQNPGLFGCIWFCSQCYKPLFGKKNVVIDHIVPLNKGGRNHVSNCTAICRKCNSSKSDIVDGRVIKGKIFKVFESATSKANKGVGAFASLGVGLSASAVSGAARLGAGAVRGSARTGGHLIGRVFSFGFRTIKNVVKGACKVITFPFRGSLLTRLCFLMIYILIIMYFLTEKTHLFDAWL